MGDGGALVVQCRTTEALTPAQRSSVIDLCIAAHDIEDFRNLFTNVGNGRHFLGYQGAELVSHAVVTTRWAQPEGQRVLQTAYVDAVSTAPDRQGLGYGTAVMRRLAAGIDDYELGCLQTDLRGFYEPPGVGAVARRTRGSERSRTGPDARPTRRHGAPPRADAPARSGHAADDRNPTAPHLGVALPSAA